MKRLFIFVLLVLIGCKKKENDNQFRVLSYTYQDVWSAVGIQYGKNYFTTYKGKGDTIIFHTNNTITEKYANKTITLSVTSFAIDTMVTVATSPTPNSFFEFKYIVYKSLENPVTDNGAFFNGLSFNNVKFSPVYNNRLSSSVIEFYTD